jgi:ABC-type transporter Mla MlaB component
MTRARPVSVKELPENLSLKQGGSLFRGADSCWNADRPRVVLDCSKLRELDSAGIQVLLSCLEEAMKRNGDVKLAAIPPGAAAILELARVDHLFEAFDSTAEAVNSFHRFPTKSFQQDLRHEYSASTRSTSTRSSGARHNRFKDRPSISREGPSDSEVTMRTSWRWLKRHIAGCIVLLLVAPIAAAAPSPQQQTIPNQQAETSSSSKAGTGTSASSAIQAQAEPPQPEMLPDSPLPNSPGTVHSQTIDDNRLSSAQQPSPKPQNDAQEPVGTAAATFIKTTGVAASRPAGAAIAPAKQRRARSILIKVAAIAGAGVAVGAVVALASASPSRPH